MQRERRLEIRAVLLQSAQQNIEEDVARLKAKPRVTGPDANAHSWNLWGAPETAQSIFGYDPEGDADYHVLKYLQETRSCDDRDWSV